VSQSLRSDLTFWLDVSTDIARLDINTFLNCYLSLTHRSNFLFHFWMSSSKNEGGFGDVTPSSVGVFIESLSVFTNGRLL
jgi:hypothetical protein